MQTARLFLISSPPRWLSSVLRHVFADLRLDAKMATQSLISCLLVIAKLVPRPVITYSEHPLPVRVRGPFASFPETYLATIPPDGTMGSELPKVLFLFQRKGVDIAGSYVCAATGGRSGRGDPAQAILCSIPCSEHPSDRRCALRLHH